jgi:hypothetical protein
MHMKMHANTKKNSPNSPTQSKPKSTNTTISSSKKKHELLDVLSMNFKDTKSVARLATVSKNSARLVKAAPLTQQIDGAVKEVVDLFKRVVDKWAASFQDLDLDITYIAKKKGWYTITGFFKFRLMIVNGVATMNKKDLEALIKELVLKLTVDKDCLQAMATRVQIGPANAHISHYIVKDAIQTTNMFMDDVSSYRGGVVPAANVRQHYNKSFDTVANDLGAVFALIYAKSKLFAKNA